MHQLNAEITTVQLWENNQSTAAEDNIMQWYTAHLCVFFNSIHAVKLVPHFLVLHFPSLHFWFCIFRSCIFLLRKFGPSFSSRIGRSLIYLVHHCSFIFRSCVLCHPKIVLRCVWIKSGPPNKLLQFKKNLLVLSEIVHTRPLKRIKNFTEIHDSVNFINI